MIYILSGVTRGNMPMAVQIMYKKVYKIGQWWQFHKTFFYVIYILSGVTLVKTWGNMPIAMQIMAKKFSEIGHWWQFHKTFFNVIYILSGVTRGKTRDNMPIAVQIMPLKSLMKLATGDNFMKLFLL